jgi:hypothetical protein
MKGEEGANDFLRGLVSPAPVVELQSDLVRGISNEPVEPLLEEEEEVEEVELPAMVECEVL